MSLVVREKNSVDNISLRCKNVVAEYVWIGESERWSFFSKARTLELEEVKDISQVPVYSFNGASTNQATARDSDVVLRPVALFRDPFRGGQNVLVLSECGLMTSRGFTPIVSNSRFPASQIIDHQIRDHEPWFSFLQQYLLMYPDFRERQPLGWPLAGFPSRENTTGGVGTGVIFGRRLNEAHYRACLFAGVTIGSSSSGGFPGAWEYSIGPCVGVRAGDMLQISRFILVRVAEDFGMKVSFEPKPIPGDWPGSGLFTTFSTKALRDEAGFEKLILMLEKFGHKHSDLLPCFGTGNDKRIPSHLRFTYAVGSREASVRIPKKVHMNQRGYFEDRRPGANSDPYIVMMKFAQTALLD